MTGIGVVGAVLVGLGAVHLLYTYVVYPWVVSLLPARAPRPGTARPRLVSVVIAARAGGHGIVDKVGNLLQTIRLPCEIIVVLDGPDPDAMTDLAALNDPRVKVEFLREGRGKAMALNRAVAMAQGDVLTFTDVRQQVAPNAVEELAAALASPDVGAVSGSLTMPSAPGSEGLYERYWRFERRLRAHEAAWDSAVGVSGALYAVKRELWRPLPDGLLLDDVWVPFQVVFAGKRVGFAPTAVATDVRSHSDAVELARKVRTLTGNYQLIAWMPWLLHPRKNRIWWQFMSHKVLRLVTPLAVCGVVAGGLLLLGRWGGVLGVLGALGLLLVWAARPARAGAAGVGVLGSVRSGLALFAALVMAALNASRGRWDVWTDPKRPPLVSPRQS
jgi:GT2 family glycosyltransferase